MRTSTADTAFFAVSSLALPDSREIVCKMGIRRPEEAGEWKHPPSIGHLHFLAAHRCSCPSSFRST